MDRKDIIVLNMCLGLNLKSENMLNLQTFIIMYQVKKNSSNCFANSRGRTYLMKASYRIICKKICFNSLAIFNLRLYLILE